MASAGIAGCRWPSRAPEIELPATAVDSSVDNTSGVVSASAISVAPKHQTGNFTIALAVFIPNNHVISPVMHPQSFTGLVPERLVFAGDDRSFDVDAVRYRAKQVVTLIPDESIDRDGLSDNSKLNLGGRTESYIAKLALADGKLDGDDRVLGKGNFVGPLHKDVPVDTRGMLIDDPIRLGPNRVSVRLRTAASGGPRDQLIAGAPSIDWDFTITIDTSGPEPKYELAGKWDGYPAMEIYVNRQPIYQHKGEGKPPTMGDLLKLAPVYGDLSVNESGTLRPAN